MIRSFRSSYVGAMGGECPARWRDFEAENEEILGFEPLNEKRVDKIIRLFYNRFRWFKQTGEMAEWFMALVLKTSDTARYRGFESLSLRHFLWRIS